MKKFLMILVVVVFVFSGCATVKKQIAQENIQFPAPAPEVEKKGGLTISDGCVTDHQDKDGRVFIEVRCKQERFVNIVVNLRPSAQYLVLIGDLSFIKKSTPDGHIVLGNPLGENITLIPELSDDELKEVKPSPPADLHFGVATDKPAYAPDASASKGGE